MKLHLETEIRDDFLEPLREVIRNQVKQEVAIAVKQVDLKGIIQNAVDAATVKLKVKHYEVENGTVKHYEIEKEKIRVPEIVYIKTPVKVPVFRETHPLIED